MGHVAIRFDTNHNGRPIPGKRMGIMTHGTPIAYPPDMSSAISATQSEIWVVPVENFRPDRIWLVMDLEICNCVSIRLSAKNRIGR